MSSLFDQLGTELGLFFEPVLNAALDADRFEELMSALGSAPDDPAGAPVAALAAAITGIVKEVETLSAEQDPSIADIGTLLESARSAFLAIEALDAPGAGAAAGLEGLAKDLIDLLAGAYLANTSSLLYRIAVLLTLVDAPQEIVATAPVLAHGKVVRGPVSLPRFHPDNAVALIRDPDGYLKSTYLTPLVTDDDANAMADKLFPRIRDLLRSVDLVTRYGVTPEELPLLGDGAPWVDHALTVWVQEEIAGADADAGATFTLSPASKGDLGLVISPFGTLQVGTDVGAWTIALAVTAEVNALAIGRRGMVFLASTATTSVDGKLSATLPAPDGGGPAFILGTPTSTRLEVGGGAFTMELGVDHDSYLWSIAADVTASTLVLSPGDGDGFLAAVLPPGGVKVPFALGLTWSSAAGLAFRGGGSLAATIPVDFGVGDVVRATTVFIGLAADETNGIAAELSLAVTVKIGPVTAVVDRVGLAAAVEFPPSGANLGVADLDFGFAPPKGAGLSIDAGVVTGGGYIGFDPASSTYSGDLDLAICDIAVKAYGLIQTTLPGGAHGYSFIGIISAEFEPGIQLPLGFSLEGIGGLLAVHRTIDEDAIASALWAGHLDGLLFPADPVTAAPQLLSALDTYFPAAPGRYVFGPLAKIGWAANMVVGKVGLLVELPEPLKLLLIGEVQVGVPAAEPVLVLHISFDGGIDFGKKLAFFDASLHDSKIERYPLTGGLAFRYGWGDDPVFALSIGGFNPHFQPPAAFPTLKRLGISISSSVAQIEAQSYIAVTSNTLQFGARVELTAGTGGFNVHGWLGFDALFEHDPLSFEFDLSAGVDLRHGTSVLASVHLDGTLSGSSPWHIAGKASLSLLFFSVSVSIDKTWGDTATALPAPDPLPALVAAFADPSAWSALPATGVQGAITPVGAPADAGGALLLDPAGGLRIAQRAVPLDQPIARFGGVPLGRTVTFSIDALSVGGHATPSSATTTEEFAPAQFLDLTDADRLSLPSFDRFGAGVVVGDDAFDVGQGDRTRAVMTSIVYDTTILDTQAPARPGKPHRPTLDAVLALDASARGRAAGLGRYAPAAGIAPRVTLTPDRWVVANTSDLVARADIAGDGTKLGALLALRDHVAASGGDAAGLQLVLAGEAV